MTRDIRERMQLFIGGVKINRLALNMDQIETYNPPPNPTKITDSRSTAYIAEFGNDSWELDALAPTVISDLIRAAITVLIDPETWDDVKADIEEHKRALSAVSDSWDNVLDYLNRENGAGE
jgi:hypothetical protein